LSARKSSVSKQDAKVRKRRYLTAGDLSCR
jgi:hypothetical protein